MNHEVLKIIANATLGITPRGSSADFPQWDGPDPTNVRIQAILCSSLALTLFAAFVAMLGKQWLYRYAQVEMRGSVIDRSRYRQRKMDGMVTWRFELVMECLPLILQVTLFLIGSALSDYLYSTNKTAAAVLISFTASSLLFYIIIISAATLSFNCPFQTPASRALHLLFRFDKEHKRYLERFGKSLKRPFFREKQQPRQGPGGLRPSSAPNGSHAGGHLGYVKRFKKSLKRLFSRMKKQPRQGAGDPPPLPAPNENRTGDHVGIPMANQHNQLSPFFTKDAEWDNHIWDSNCIAWMFKMSTDPDFILAILKFIPEITWHAGIQTTPLETLYDTLVDCFDRSTGRPIVIPKLRNKAYFSAKAVLHLATQRRCIGDERSTVLLKTISDKHVALGSYHYEGDSDLESVLDFIDCALDKSGNIDWKHFSFTPSHRAWMCQPLICSAWHALEKGNKIPAAVEQFILHTINSEPPPPSIATDIFFLVGCLFEVNIRHDALLLVDRR